MGWRKITSAFFKTSGGLVVLIKNLVGILLSTAEEMKIEVHEKKPEWLPRILSFKNGPHV